MAKKKTSSGSGPAPPTVVKPKPVSIEGPYLILVDYVSIVPIQLIAQLFTLITATSTLSSSATKNFLSSPSKIIQQLSSSPIQFLFYTTLGFIVVQSYFGLWARKSRTNAIGLNRNKEGIKKVKKGFFGALKDMRDEITRTGAAPKLDKKVQLDFNFAGEGMLVTLAAAVVFYGAFLLLGAPLLQNAAETMLLALMVSVLAILPIALAIPIKEKYVWTRLFSSFSPANELETALLLPAVGTIIGCWLGAIPIPLDWDQTWQKWPTSCVIGALGGHTVGTLVSLVIAVGRAINTKQKLE